MLVKVDKISYRMDNVFSPSFDVFFYYKGSLVLSASSGPSYRIWVGFTGPVNFFPPPASSDPSSFHLVGTGLYSRASIPFTSLTVDWYVSLAPFKGSFWYSIFSFRRDTFEILLNGLYGISLSHSFKFYYSDSCCDLDFSKIERLI